VKDLPSPTGDVSKRFQNSVYRSTATPEPIKSDLEQIQVQDKDLEKKKQTALWSAFGFLVLVVASAILHTVVATTFTIFAVIGMIVSGIVCCAYALSDIPDMRYQIARKTVELVERDMERKEPIDITLKLGNVDKPENAVRKGWDRTCYADRWLYLKGYFADGTRFAVSITELLHVKTRKGKRKPKGQVLTLVLKYSPSEYGDLAPLSAQLKNTIKTAPGSTFKSMRIGSNYLRLSFKVFNSPYLQMQTANQLSDTGDSLTKALAVIFLNAFQILNFARALNKSSSTST